PAPTITATLSLHDALPIFYQEWANWLVEHDLAYRCYCTPERLEALRKEQIARKEDPGYDRHCRNLSPEERARNEAEGKPFVIRLDRKSTRLNSSHVKISYA